MNWEKSDDEGSDDFENKNNQFAGLATKTANKNYDKYAEDSDSDDKADRKVKTPYEKAKEYITSMKKDVDKVKENDFEEYIQYYKDVIKNFEKSRKDYDEDLTKIFIRVLYKIGKKTEAIEKDKLKEFYKARITAFNELKKLIRKNDKNYGEMIKNYKANITEEEKKEDETKDEEVKKVDEDVVSDPELSDDVVIDNKKSGSDDSDVDLNDNTEDPAIRRLKWVKKPKDLEKLKDKDKDKDGVDVKGGKGKGKKQPKPRHEKEYVETETKVKELSDAMIEKECTELSNQRGQQEKNSEIMSRVDVLISSTSNKSVKIKLLNLYVHVCFDSSKGQFFALNISMWQKIYDSIIQLVNLYLDLREAENYNATDENMV